MAKQGKHEDELNTAEMFQAVSGVHCNACIMFSNYRQLALQFKEAPNMVSCF